MGEDALIGLLKWLLIGCAAGYPFLGGFIVFLVRELLKAKDANTSIVKEATIHNREMRASYDRIICVLDKVAELLK